MTDIKAIRRRFAEEVRRKAEIRSDALATALACVPRERFLGLGPWHLGVHIDGAEAQYRVSDTAEAAEVYRDTVIAIDPVRGLNNGEPSSLARWIDALDLKAGETVVHIGSGTGYYSALMAHIVGAHGQVMAYEVDADIASRAVENLTDYPQVTVRGGSAGNLPVRGVDAIFVNCGITHPPRSWLDSLADGGRILLPLTMAEAGSAVGIGAMYLATRAGEEFHLDYISSVGIFHCVGQRDETLNEQLRCMAAADWRQPRTLRLDSHVKADSCWLHAESCCMSKERGHANAA
jgi:protein-L-isoaspartate(D-aspartate) O-methyltransferase